MTRFLTEEECVGTWVALSRARLGLGERVSRVQDAALQAARRPCTCISERVQLSPAQAAALSAAPAAAAAPAGKERMVREAYRFLHHQGCINFGVLRDDPAVPLPTAEPKAEGEAEAELANGDGAAAGGGAAPAEGAAAEPAEGGAAAEGAAEAKLEPTDEAVAEQLYRILEGVDLQVRGRRCRDAFWVLRGCLLYCMHLAALCRAAC